jgi:thiol-disulfide isomerase/thioredoxin
MELEQKPRRSRHEIVSTVALVVALLFAGVIAYTQRPWAERAGGTDDIGLIGGAPGAPMPGAMAPDFVLTRADGSPLRLSDYRGQAVFLNFWATWCVFCIEEMPDMQRIADEFDGRLVVIGINNGESVATGEDFVRHIDARYEIVYDLDRSVVNGYRVRAMPTSYFIDADGRIVTAHFGFMTYDTMQERITALFEASRS